jgi:hypothetical protein
MSGAVSSDALELQNALELAVDAVGMLTHCAGLAVRALRAAAGSARDAEAEGISLAGWNPTLAGEDGETLAETLDYLAGHIEDDGQLQTGGRRMSSFDFGALIRQLNDVAAPALSAIAAERGNHA